MTATPAVSARRAFGQRRHLELYVAELHLPVLDVLQAIRERGEHTPKAWIGGDRRQQRLRTRKAFPRRAKLSQRQQQAIAIEERTTLRLLHSLE